TIESFNTPLAQHTPAIKNASALSETLIAEFQSADVVLLSVPMYNFTIPSVLKAYIDHIVRIGFTFDYHAQKGLYGLLENKHAIVCSAMGSVFSDQKLAAMDHLQPYLKMLLGFIGIEKIDMLCVEGTSTDPQALARSKEIAQAKILDIIKQKGSSL
ncbi:MAG: FMN-dependent NADH-azoreductase, partial [Thiohalomonadales bacterium]